MIESPVLHINKLSNESFASSELVTLPQNTSDTPIMFDLGFDINTEFVDMDSFINDIKKPTNNIIDMKNNQQYVVSPKKIGDFAKARELFSINKTRYEDSWDQINQRAAFLQAICCPPANTLVPGSSTLDASPSFSISPINSGHEKKGKHDHCKNCGKDLEGNEKTYCASCSESEGGE